MPTYGAFETVEELASAGPFAVYAARKAGQTGAPAYAVKVYKTADVFADAEVVERESAAFLEAAEVQRSLPAGPAGGGGAGHWAPVHDAGRASDAVYYVTDLYPVSVQRMVDSRRELDARSIAHVIEGVVAGLEELEKTHKRGHGGLQASNVLLGSVEVEEAAIALTDPEAGSRLEANAPVQDQRGMAALLYQMVVHRMPPRAGAVAGGPEWQRMGAAGELLRGLCETLLNVQAGQLVPLEQVRAKLAEVLKAKPPAKAGMSVGAKLGIAAAVLLAVGGGVFVAMREPPKVEIVYEDARRAWTPGDVGSLDTRLAKVRKLIKDDPVDAEEAGKLAAQLKELSESIAWLKNQPPPASEEQSAFIKSEIANRDERYTKATAALVSLEERWFEDQADPTQDPRKPSPDRWLAAWMSEIAEHVTVADRLLSSDAAVRAEFEQLRTDAEALKKLVEETRGKAWGTEPAAQAEIVKIAGEAKASALALRPKLKAVRVGARDQLIEYVKKAGDGAASLRSAQLQDRMTASLRKLREDLEESETRGWQEVTGQVAKLDELLKSIDGAFAATLGLEAPAAGSEVVYAGAEKHLVDLRESLISKLPEATDAADAGLRAKVEQAAGTYNARVADLRAMYTAAQKVETLLAAGYGLDESVEGASIAALDAAVRGAQGFEPLKAGLDKVLARVDALKEVKAMSSAPALVGVINDAGSGLSSVLTAWRALRATGYPASASDLSAAIDVQAKVVAAVRKSAGARAAGLTSEVEGQLRALWLRFIENAKGDVPQVNAAFELTTRVPGGAEAIAGGPAWLKYNRERWELLKAVEGVGEAPAKEQIEQLHTPVMAFVNDAKGLNLNRPEVAQFDKDLNPFVIKKVVTMDEMGPGRVKWAFEEDKARGLVRYRWTGKRGEHVLEFRPMVMGEDQVTYLCTTEMPVGLFIDAVEAFGKWDDVRGVGGQGKKLLDGSNLETRAGVRTVRWVGSGDKMKMDKSVPANTQPHDKNGMGWHATNMADTMARNPYYPEGGGPGRPPSDLDPVDWVSPEASLYVARVLGCRLPSSAEWKAAAATGANATPNLRDESYARQYQHVADNIGDDKFQAKNIMNYPGSGIMVLQNGAPVAAELDGSALTVNDGYLYFAPVNERRQGAEEPKFHHLIGNVWEFTHEAPLAAEALPQATYDSVMGLMGQGYANMRVIGGSALSNPQVGTTEPQEFKRTTARQGWADVGFRLAFSTGAGAGGGGSPKQRLLGMLQKTPYLSAGAN
ncbi:MAG TPA: SUMF1/EgtB/PvdO family nonheme iron enzyme [Phycisphaerales bacterium]|nr:SUMF1/EgtB/PvdO family nonheme iron enzyme [Phycisphaerales bacterium]